MSCFMWDNWKETFDSKSKITIVYQTLAQGTGIEQYTQGQTDIYPTWNKTNTYEGEIFLSIYNYQITLYDKLYNK